jgi:hypothetical protein
MLGSFHCLRISGDKIRLRPFSGQRCARVDEEDFRTRRSHVIIETIVVGRASDNLLSSNSQSGRLLTLSFLRQSSSRRSLALSRDDRHLIN